MGLRIFAPVGVLSNWAPCTRRSRHLTTPPDSPVLLSASADVTSPFGAIVASTVSLPLMFGSESRPVV